MLIKALSLALHYLVLISVGTSEASNKNADPFAFVVSTHAQIVLEGNCDRSGSVLRSKSDSTATRVFWKNVSINIRAGSN